MAGACHHGRERLDETKTTRRPGRPGAAAPEGAEQWPPRSSFPTTGPPTRTTRIALGGLFARAGAEVALAYVRHTPRTDASRSTAEAKELLARGAALLGDPEVRHLRRHRPLDPRGAARRSPSAEGADVIVFCSDSHTAKGHVGVGNSAERLLEGGSTAVAIAPVGLRRARPGAGPRHGRRGRRRRRRRPRDRRVAGGGARRHRGAGRQRRRRPAGARLARRKPSRAGSRSAPRPAPDRVATLPGAGAAARRARSPSAGSRASPPQRGLSARRGRARAQASRRLARARRADRARASSTEKSSAPPRRWPSGPVQSHASRRRSARKASAVPPPGARYRGGVAVALNTRVTELADSRVRVEVQVPPDEIEERLQRNGAPARTRPEAPRASAAGRCRRRW